MGTNKEGLKKFKADVAKKVTESKLALAQLYASCCSSAQGAFILEVERDYVTVKNVSIGEVKIIEVKYDESVDITSPSYDKLLMNDDYEVRMTFVKSKLDLVKELDDGTLPDDTKYKANVVIESLTLELNESKILLDLVSTIKDGREAIKELREREKC